MQKNATWSKCEGEGNYIMLCRVVGTRTCKSHADHSLKISREKRGRRRNLKSCAYRLTTSNTTKFDEEYY